MDQLPASPTYATPLTWAWGGLLLTATAWLAGIFALINALANLIG